MLTSRKDLLVLVAIITIGTLEMYALSQRIDGSLFSVVVGVIAGLVGYKIKEKRNSY